MLKVLVAKFLVKNTHVVSARRIQKFGTLIDMNLISSFGS